MSIRSAGVRYLGVAGATLAFSGVAQAYTIPEFVAIYTVANIQAAYPGYTAADYNALSTAISNTLPTSSNCVQAFNDYFNSNIQDPPTADACFSDLQVAVIAAGATTLFTAQDIDEGMMSMYFAYSATKIVGPIISLQVQQATSMRQAEAISNAISSIINPSRKAGPARVSLGNGEITGLAAGGVGSKPSFWISGYGNTMQNTHAGARYDGDVYSFIGGADYTLNPEVVVGVSMAYENTRLATQYNNGSYLADSWMIAPYVGYIIDKTWSVDASAGYAFGNSEIRWNSGFVSMAKQKLTRNFIALNLNAQQWMGDTELSGKASLIRAEENIGVHPLLQNTKINNSITQMKLTGRVGYWMNDYEPYVSLSYVRDLQMNNYDRLFPGLKDKDGWGANVGVDLITKQGMTGGIYYSAERGRSHLKSDGLMANFSYRF